MENSLCPDCGSSVEVAEQEDFDRRADAICEALDGIDDPNLEMELLTLFVGRFLAGVPAEHRKRWRRFFIKIMDESTKEDVIAMCDA